MHRGARELLAQARILAVVLWAVLIIDASGGAGVGRVSGQLLGTDFVQFYTLASAARDGRLDVVATVDGQRAEQLRAVPQSREAAFPPVYPPQVGLVLRPLASLPYGRAYLAWVTASLVMYAAAIYLLARASPGLLAWPPHLRWLSAAFPALWFVALHGQLSAVATLCLGATAWALSGARPWLAGAALGMLAYKPTLLAPVLVVCTIAGDWRIVSGAMAAGAAQYGVAALLVDAGSVRAYVATMIELAGRPDAVASNLPLMHSLRTFFSRWLPATAATACYGVSATVVAVMAARLWRGTRDPLLRTGGLALAIVLVSPHLFVYDLLILAPALMASAHILTRSDNPPAALKPLTYAGFLMPVWSVPVAALTGVQASTVLLVAWLVTLASGRRFG